MYTIAETAPLVYCGFPQSPQNDEKGVLQNESFCNTPFWFLPISAKTIACGRVIEREGGSKTAPFTLPLPGACFNYEYLFLLQQSPFFRAYFPCAASW